MKNKTTSQAAAALGSIKSEAKAAAARENGKRGGRPRTNPVRYRVHYSRGTSRDFTRKDAAIRNAKAEVKDGWTTRVTDLSSDETIWQG